MRSFERIGWRNFPVCLNLRLETSVRIALLRATAYPRLSSFPNSCLGTQVCETLFRVPRFHTKQSFERCVPKREFGNEGTRENWSRERPEW